MARITLRKDENALLDPFHNFLQYLFDWVDVINYK